MNRPRFLIRVAVITLMLGFLTASSVSAFVSAAWVGPSWRERHEFYKQTVGKRSLNRKSVGIYTLASTDVDAKRVINAFEDRYEKPETWPEQIQMTMVEAWAKYNAKPDNQRAFESFLKKHAEARDVYLWSRLVPLIRKDGDNTFVIDLYTNSRKNIFARLAALETVKFADFSACAAFVLDVFANELAKEAKPKELLNRELHIVALLDLVGRHKPDVKSEAYGKIFEITMKLFEDAALSEDCKRRMGRMLQEIYRNGEVHINSFRWRAVHRQATRDGEKESGRTAVQRPRFAGIEANGRRIIYVIDMSDSMLEPVKRPPPITGTGEKKSKSADTGSDKEKKDEEKKDSDDADKDDDENGDKEKEPEIDLVSEDDLNWDKIKNRFDLARECLRLSLKRLEEVEGLQFSVVLFNEDARYANATRGLQPLNTWFIEKVMAELDAIKPTPCKDDRKRPHGTLSEGYRTSKRGGGTNLHGALRLAFAAKPDGSDMEYSNVNPDLLSLGCDAVFVLSDGSPTECDFDEIDPTDPGTRHVDDLENPESKEAGPLTRYISQFRRSFWIYRDLRRLNMFRHAEVHCIAIGEADVELLRRIAKEGYGRVAALGTGDDPPKKKK